MHSEGKKLLLHDGLGRAKAQKQHRVRGSDREGEYGVLAISAGTVRQLRPDTDQGSGQQPLHINDHRLLIGPPQNGFDGVLVQGVLGCILPNFQSICMPVLFSRQVGPKQADCQDAEGLSEWHLFAHKGLIVVGIPVLGAETLRQFVLERGAARFGLTVAGARQWQVICIAHAGKVDDVNDTQFLGIKNALPVPDPHSADQSPSVVLKISK